MSFSFRFDGLADGDYLTMGVSNENLFTMEARYIKDKEWTRSGIIDIARYAGKTTDLFFALNSGGAPGGQMSVTDIEFITVKPSLTIEMGTNQAVLSWSTIASGYQVQETTQLGAGTVWSNVTNPVVKGEYFYSVTNELSGTDKFYRLIKR
jgi:hypothetical protein